MVVSFAALAAILCLAVMVVGLFGIVLPFFPGGVPLVWFGALLYGVFTRFERVDVPFLAALGVLVLLTYVFEYWHQRWGLKELKVTPAAVIGAVIGGIVAAPFGLFPSLTFAPILGAVIGEMAVGRDSAFMIETDAFKIIGFIGSSIVKVSVGVTIIGLWLAKAF